MPKMEKITYQCAEFNCNYYVEADSGEELIRAVQKHTAEEHDSFELEEIILANSKRVIHDK